MTYRYGHTWNADLSKPVKETDEAGARRLWESGPQVSVSRIEDGRAVPDYTLVLGPGGSHVRVVRYDVNGSTSETFDYSFRKGEDRLFLDNYKVYVYRDGADGPQTFLESVAHRSWVFREDGTATSREVVKPAPGARISEFRDLDLRGHWRARPAFGEWDGFGKHPEPLEA